MKKIFFFLFFPFSLSAQFEEVLEDTLQAVEITEDTSFSEEEEIIEEDYVREPYTAPPLAPISLREVPDELWDEATGEMDYSKDVPKPPKVRKKRAPKESSPSFDWTGMTQGLGNLLQVLAILFALAMIAYGIYWMMQAPRNRRLSRDGTEITLANLDEYIHETDLERFLREALAQANWPLAIRLYFLQTIKLLSEKDLILWSKEKTNRDYLREMRGHRLGTHFRDATRQYERVWYGNQALTSEEFAQMEPLFKALLEEI
ncbi:MAG: DUF4129 domain-containing protein [Saprospiraceae bacterium]